MDRVYFVTSPAVKVRRRRGEELPLHLWPTRIPGTGPAGSVSTTSCYGQADSTLAVLHLDDHRDAGSRAAVQAG